MSGYPQGKHGLFSNPDSARQHRDIDQQKWSEFSDAVINEIVERIKKSSSDTPVAFENIYRFCAEKRGEFAQAFGQSHKRFRDYGTYRGERRSADEYFGRPDGPWRIQSEAVFFALENLIASAAFKDDFCKKDYCNIRKASEHEFSIIVIYRNQKQGGNRGMCLAEIEYNKKDKQQARISYASRNISYMDDEYQLANTLWQACLDWQPEEGVENFLIRLGRLQHLMAHLLPVRLGNAGIMGWIQHATAKIKGITLGAYTQEDGKGHTISWDFMALVTPNPKEYAHWFAKHAFVSATFTEQEKALPKKQF